MADANANLGTTFMTAEPTRPGDTKSIRLEWPDNDCPTSVKVELVLRLLRGDTLEDLSRETGRRRKQLSAWRRRFLAGGEAHLDARCDQQELEMLRSVRDDLTAQLAELEAENRTLARRLARLSANRSADIAPHPTCSDAYALALEEPGVSPLYVDAWGTYVFVRAGHGSTRPATGVRPYASLDPRCDVRAGLDELRQAGITSVSLIADPMWSPEVSVLQEAFDTCRPFKENYLIDRETSEVHIRKRHRNMINRAQKIGEVREISLGDYLSRWLELYARLVDTRQITQPFGPLYFERLAVVDGVRTIAVLVDGEIATITVWIRHGDVLYFHDGASSEKGVETSASYAAFAHVIENATDCRYIVLGGSSDFRDERRDGLAVFKRGFSNTSVSYYLCTAALMR